MNNLEHYLNEGVKYKKGKNHMTGDQWTITDIDDYVSINIGLTKNGPQWRNNYKTPDKLSIMRSGKQLAIIYMTNDKTPEVIAQEMWDKFTNVWDEPTLYKSSKDIVPILTAAFDMSIALGYEQ